MSDQTYAATPPVDDNAAQQEAQKALEAEEIEQFLTKLEQDAETMKMAWMSARVPAYMREAYDAKFPPPEPDAPTAAFLAAHPDAAVPVPAEQ